MGWKSIVLVLGGVVLVALGQRADAHSYYRAALAEKFDAHVNCQACHLSRTGAEKLSPEDQLSYMARPKSFYNDFGQAFVPLLESSKVNEEIDFIYQLRRRGNHVPANSEEMQRLRDLREKGKQELLGVLSKVEVMRDPASSKTYRELLRAGKLEGIRLREEPLRMPSDD